MVRYRSHCTALAPLQMNCRTANAKAAPACGFSEPLRGAISCSAKGSHSRHCSTCPRPFPVSVCLLAANQIRLFLEKRTHKQHRRIITLRLQASQRFPLRDIDADHRVTKQGFYSSAAYTCCHRRQICFLCGVYGVSLEELRRPRQMVSVDAMSPQMLMVHQMPLISFTVTSTWMVRPVSAVIERDTSHNCITALWVATNCAICMQAWHAGCDALNCEAMRSTWRD